MHGLRIEGRVNTRRLPVTTVSRRGAPGLMTFLLGLALVSMPAALHADPPRIYAITHARVHAAPDRVIENGTVVVRDGLIDVVGEGAEAPADADVIDATGMTLTYGFIDGCSRIGQKEESPGRSGPPGGAPGGGGRGTETPPGPVHPLPRVKAEARVADTLVVDDSAFEKHRKMGFTTALTLPGSGIFRGEAALINLGGKDVPTILIQPAVGQVIALETGRFGTGYPNSLMGAIAAVRQTLLDAQRWAVWEDRYRTNPVGMKRPDQTAALAALAGAATGRARTIFDLDAVSNVARVVELGREYSLQSILIGSGLEHTRPELLESVRGSGYPMILPLAYPKDPKVEDADEALDTTTRDLERWDAAPDAPRRFADAGIPFALGTCRLDGAGEFPDNLRKAIDRGLTTQTALAALTVHPARFLGMDRVMGTIEKGRIANLALFEGVTDEHDVFAEKAAVRRVFIDGVSFEMERSESKADPDARVDPRGTWSITTTIAGRTTNRTWIIGGEEGMYEGTAETRDGTVTLEYVRMNGNEMTVKLPGSGGRPGQELKVIITGETLSGSGAFPGGMSYSLKGKRTAGPEGGAL